MIGVVAWRTSSGDGTHATIRTDIGEKYKSMARVDAGMVLCKSCRFCADGVGGHRKCYLDIDHPVPMTCLRHEERENCKYYRHSDEPSNRRFGFEHCPICGKRMALKMIGNGAVRPECMHCSYVGRPR